MPNLNVVKQKPCTLLKNIILVFALACHTEKDVSSKEAISLAALSANNFTTEIYGNLDPVTYLTGNYSPEGILEYRQQNMESAAVFLRHEAHQALENMLYQYNIDTGGNNPINIKIGFRSREDQLNMWNMRYTGEIPMRLLVDNLTMTEKVTLILEYLSPPGTSRHHWGTEIDIGIPDDPAKKTQMLDWLESNSLFYGFCQPYNPITLRNNTGLQEENWHWSYFYLASFYQNKWLEQYGQNKIIMTQDILGFEVLLNIPFDIVSSVNTDCI